MLVPNEQMTDDMWAAWDWPADHVRLPSDKRTVALSLWRRDGNICQVCGLKVDIILRNRHPAMASADHIIPLRRYAPKYETDHLNVWGNVRLSHLCCNTAHADFDAEWIAVADYRKMLRLAVEQFETTGSWLPPKTGFLQLEAPLVTPAWQEETTNGRPTGSFGEEWTTPESSAGPGDRTK
jgi:5-methylcytosine-specific restriction endonuclease McrA